MIVRAAAEPDAGAMSEVLREIISLTGKQRPHERAFVLENYIHHPERVACSVVVVDEEVLGFQSLRLATEGNGNGVAIGWGIIGTHISPRAHRRGAGKALFAETLRAARLAGIHHMDATIGVDNEHGPAFYDALGFVSYKQDADRIAKRFDVL